MSVASQEGSTSREAWTVANAAHTEAIRWYVRSLESVAIGLYMSGLEEGRAREAYEGVKAQLSETLHALRSFMPNGWGCPDDLCPDPWDRCVPCGDERPFLESR